jgi:hypothetical protein
MGHFSRRSRFTRCRLINGYLPALERIDSALEEAYPELEESKIKRAMELLFGERPTITDFSDQFPVSHARNQSDFRNPH